MLTIRLSARFLSGVAFPIVAGLASVAAISAPPPVPAPPPAAVRQIQIPPPEAMVIMIRSSLVALSQANLTNNYSVLNGLGSKAFQAANPPQRLAITFASFRNNTIDLSPIVYLSPQLTSPPALVGGTLRLIGYFPSSPMRVNFDLSFEPDQARWKLSGLGVNLSVAPQTAAAQPQK